ncbi:acetyl-CoA carboxylase biotin carboxyl carrier protein [Lactobacillus colini]|nr:acetyl-CoA carboxylase biotin carboxyl carrier protein [Lactobacillus colini]
MELENIQALMNQFEDSDLRELKIDDGDFHLYLSKNKNNAPLSQSAQVSQTVKPQVQESTVATPQVSQEDSDLTAVKAPIVGVVYLQAKPGQPAFVKVGDHVKKGDTICIIEAMKMMTEVKSTATGIVSEIKVENEDLVEVDQPLIMVKEN